MFNRPSRRAISVAALVLAAPALWFLGDILLTPTKLEDRLPTLVTSVLAWFDQHGMSWMTMRVAEGLGNVAVFVPVGVLAYVLIRERWRGWALAVGPATSAMIETIQAVFLPERVPSLSDLGLNSAGSTLGVLLAWCVATMVPRRPLPRPSTIRSAAHPVD